MPAPAAHHQNPMLGISLKILSVTTFVGMATLIKAAPDVPTGELVFFRSFFALIPILIFLGLRGELKVGIRTSRPVGHMLRGLLGVTAMLLSFYALIALPLPEATSIGYATPLIIVVFSALFLNEQVRLYRWTAVIIGLLGVLIIVWPNLTLFSGDTPMSTARFTGVLAAITAAVFAAAASLTVRKLVQTERSATIVLFFSLTASAVALMTIPFGWIMPSPSTWALLIGAGIAGGIAQILLTESYRHADISIVAPFEYTSMLLSILVGYFVFGDVPTLYVIVGGAIVVAAGIFIIYREHRLGLERGRARKLITPQG